jgi:APA family basic amino acid/polyamine antiporter
MKLYPILPLIFMGAYTFVGISISIQTPSIALIGISVLAVFMAIYFISRLFSKKIELPKEDL